jgi:dolichol-phosphate mannosyltransferase
MANVVIVIPTYNERESTGRMIESLATEFKQIKGHNMSLLYVDDTSPDKTYEVVRDKMKKYDWLHLQLNPKKKGLGKAYAKGFQYAMKKLNADYVMEFDGDFQHRPDEIKKLLKKIDEGYEYIIGSRYIKGGSIPVEWSFNRRFLSVVGNMVARISLLLPNVHDVTTGFKLTKTKGILERIDLDNLYSDSFAYKVQILGQAIHGGAKWVEVPITFEARREGESKIIKNEILETLKVIALVQIKNPKIRKFAKFGIVGFVGYLVNATGLAIFSRMEMPEPVIWGLATEGAIISNFIFNNIWTFKADQITGILNLIYKFVQFNITSAGALLIQMVFGTLGVRIFGPESRQLLLPFIIVLLVLPYNYAMYNLVIWRSWRKN